MVKKQLKILVVDDNEEITQMVCLFLARKNFLVSLAYSAEEALEIIEKNRQNNNPDYDLLITDHDMPGMTGAELTLHIRREKKLPCRIILMSSRIADDIIPYSADFFLRKPFDMDQLLDSIIRVMI